MAQVQAPRGTFDVLGDDALKRGRLEAEARKVLEPAGYRRIETPVFEHTELFARGVGESTDVVQKEMYTFDDRSGRSLTLRPEGTAAVCRAYATHGLHKQPAPSKLWYLGPFFRYEAPQSGRFRQFWQVGAEAIGSDDPAVDAETILLLADLLERMEVTGAALHVGSLGSLQARQAYRERLVAHLRAHEDQLSEEVRGRIDLNPLRAFDADDPGTKAVMETAPKLVDHLEADDAEHFAEVRRLLDAAGIVYAVDPSLVRGLDYYTRTIFEFVAPSLGAVSGVGGGGRYDGLVEQVGGPKGTAGMGWAAGVERILLAAGPQPVAPAPTEVFVALAKPEARVRAFALVQQLRRAGHSAQMELAGRSLKTQLKTADKLRVTHVAVVGEEETIGLKDMQTGEQQDIAADSVMHHLRGGQLR